jgi:hypothetical protein
MRSPVVLDKTSPRPGIIKTESGAGIGSPIPRAEQLATNQRMFALG